MTKEQLLAEIEDVLRTVPPKPTITNLTEESLTWFGRAAAVVEQWNSLRGPTFRHSLRQVQGQLPVFAAIGFTEMMTTLHEARHDLRMQTVGPLTAVVSQGSVFDYFDEIRKIIESATEDLLFVDPYLDAEFVSRYLPHVVIGVTIRLLALKKLPTLLPAVEAFASQSKALIEVRSAIEFHDRYVFVDKESCYQSGASFKDGAKSAPTTLTQITDAFPAVLGTYEDLWNRAQLQFPRPATTPTQADRP